MNMQNNPTVVQLAALFAQVDDEAGHHCLWIDRAGDVRVDSIPEDLSPNGFEASKPTMAARFETFVCGNGYVGQEAAEDSAYIEEKFNQLVDVWKSCTPDKVIYFDGFDF